MGILTQLYTHCQGSFIPLHPDSKKPIDTAWTSLELNGQTAASALAFLSVGYNAGYRIPEHTLIIDVDPRNGGNESFLKLPDDVQALPITTITPSGGYHVYTQIPKSHHDVPLRSSLKDVFPGIDFLRQGKQVLLPGSSLPGDFYYAEQSLPVPAELRLPDRLYYQLHPQAVTPLPLVPLSLLALLERPVVDSSTIPSGFLTNTDLTSALTNLPVLDYNDNDSWLSIMLACHHATAGDGLEAFLAWSLQDPDYASQEQIIRSRWNSATVDDTGAPMITVRTLVHEIQKHGPAPSWLRIKAGMQQQAEDLFDPISQPSQDLATAVAGHLQAITAEQDPFRLIPTMAITIASDSALLESHREMLLMKVAKKGGTSLTALKKDIRALLKAPKNKAPAALLPTSPPSAPGGIVDFVQPTDESQLDLRIASALLDRVAHDCDNIYPIVAAGEWWLWDGKHWSKRTSDQDLKRLCISTIQLMGVIVKSTNVQSITDLARFQIETSYDNLLGDTSKTRVFCQNVVLTFNTESNAWEQSPHSPANHNLAVVSAHFDPAAPIPSRWLSFLHRATTSDHARRTLACAIVYAAGGMDPWLRKAFFLYGPTGTGKSATLDFLENFLGQTNCTSLSITQLGSRNGPAELVGKLANISNETLSKSSFQDDIFKSLVSGESLLVEKKYKDPFPFRNKAKMFLAANGFPRVRDESEAVWDRIVLLSYPNQIPENEMDPFLQEKLALEYPGILNWALKIYAEEYEKDQCRSIMLPDEHGLRDKMIWRRVNNPALEWLRERTVAAELDDRVAIDQAYQDYRSWTKREGHMASAKNHFSRVISKMYRDVKDADGKKLFVGVKLKPLEFFNVKEN